MNSLVVPVYGNARFDSGADSRGRGDSRTGRGRPGGDFRRRRQPRRFARAAVERPARRHHRGALVEHSRNFGSFAAIRTGMSLARGERIAVMAADLQEPPELVVEFFRRLAAGERRRGRRRASQPRRPRRQPVEALLAPLPAVGPSPRCRRAASTCSPAPPPVRDVVCSLESVHTSLVAQLFWVGFRPRARRLRPAPSARRPSGWTLRRKLRYLSDSVFAFTDLPVRCSGWSAGRARRSAIVVGV